MSVDIFIEAFSLVLILIASIILYVVLTAQILPRILLKPEYDMRAVSDRGIKKYKFDGGRAIVYEPCMASKKYIEQYVLSSNSDEKFIRCKLNEQIRNLKYDIATFDSNDKMIDLIRVRENVINKGFSRSTMLPYETAYVCVNVCEVNGTSVGKGAGLTLPVLKVGIFLAVTVVLSIIEGVCMHYAIASVMESLLSIEIGGIGFAGALVFMLIGAILSVLISLLHCSKNVKIRVKQQ